MFPTGGLAHRESSYPSDYEHSPRPRSGTVLSTDTGKSAVYLPVVAEASSSTLTALRGLSQSEPGRLTGATRRDAASSVAPICLHIGAPCVLASHHVSRVIHRDV